ncbi:MAG TPA: hypothetical protein VKB19_06355 [Pedobacter sp.]|nr:hypothetical protein [Pedobacter sp.]
MSDKRFDVDKILDDLFPKTSLNEIFEKRLYELDIPPTKSLEILNIEYRALQGMLLGTKKMVDCTNFIKLANFLRIPRNEVVSLYLDELEKNFPDSPEYPKRKVDFIKENFDLAALRKAKFINSLTDYAEIESRINRRFGYKSIFEYQPLSRGVAFSAGVIEPKKKQSRNLWIENTLDAFRELANPYEYDRAKLIKYIPSIRWQCTNIEEGLLYVITDLFRLGVSVLYQSPLSNLHIRGATFVINDKPCIALTNYKNFYPTLWFALIHEIYHTLFDLDEISENTYHVSDDEEKDLSLKDKEDEANKFAQEYFFSADKMQKAKPHIDNRAFIKKFAAENHIDPSFIYVFYANEFGAADEKAWQRAHRYNPNFDNIKNSLDLSWIEERSIREHIGLLKQTKIYS